MAARTGVQMPCSKDINLCIPSCAALLLAFLQLIESASGFQLKMNTRVRTGPMCQIVVIRHDRQVWNAACWNDLVVVNYCQKKIIYIGSQENELVCRDYSGRMMWTAYSEDGFSPDRFIAGAKTFLTTTRCALAPNLPADSAGDRFMKLEEARQISAFDFHSGSHLWAGPETQYGRPVWATSNSFLDIRVIKRMNVSRSKQKQSYSFVTLLEERSMRTGKIMHSQVVAKSFAAPESNVIITNRNKAVLRLLLDDVDASNIRTGYLPVKYISAEFKFFKPRAVCVSSNVIIRNPERSHVEISVN